MIEDEVHAKLLERLGELDEEDRISAESRAPVALQQDSVGRLEDGEWGWCLTCGEQIAEARLRHDPSVPQCVGCAGAA